MQGASIMMTGKRLFTLETMPRHGGTLDACATHGVGLDGSFCGVGYVPAR